MAIAFILHFAYLKTLTAVAKANAVGIANLHNKSHHITIFDY